MAEAARRLASAGDDEMLLVLREIRDELRLHRLEHASHATPRLSRADRAYLAKLLPAIGGAFGSELFFCRDVIESDSPAVRLVRGKLTAKALGKLFSRATGVPVAGYLVTTDGVEAGANLWRVKQVLGGSGLSL